MQDADLLVQLAAIAGVFVGFAALIAVRSGGASDAHEVAYIRSIVSIAVWVAVVALAPVTLSRYGLAGHDLWRACSILALFLVLGTFAVNSRTPEMRQEYAASSRREAAINALLLVSLVVALSLVALGPFPNQEPALYLTAVELGLLGTALTLLLLVFSQRRSLPVSDPAALPATGGSSA
jgi:multisubunit Na+/H+ antiporter MnhC subunit